MFTEILKSLEPFAKDVSYYSRMKNTQAFLEEAGVNALVNPPHREEPLTIIWAISIQFADVFNLQLRSLLQLQNILQDHDQIIFVAEKERKPDVEYAIGNLADFVKTKVIYIDRHCVGDRPTLNWDIGMDYAEHNRVLFIRDLCLFFEPWKLIGAARALPLDRLTNMSVILGPTVSRFTDQWVYLVHPLYSPTPFLFTFVADRDQVKAMGGFDRTFSRGFDHAGDLDFVLRWVMAGNSYDIHKDVTVLHPGIPTSKESLEDMQFHSSVNRRYFYDRYDEKFIEGLKPPFRLDAPLVEVNYAKTMSPLMEVILDEPDINYTGSPITFLKRPNDYYIVEEQ